MLSLHLLIKWVKNSGPHIHRIIKHIQILSYNCLFYFGFLRKVFQFQINVSLGAGLQLGLVWHRAFASNQLFDLVGSACRLRRFSLSFGSRTRSRSHARALYFIGSADAFDKQFSCAHRFVSKMRHCLGVEPEQEESQQ